jgi:hypothetical protein
VPSLFSRIQTPLKGPPSRHQHIQITIPLVISKGNLICVGDETGLPVGQGVEFAGLVEVKTAAGYVSDYSVFLEGAKKSSFGDENSVVDPYVAEFAIKDHPLRKTITFSINDAPFRVKGPRVNAELVGVFPTVGQTIEDRYGHPIEVDTDFSGKKYPRPIAGPLADLKQGENTVIWSMHDAK